MKINKILAVAFLAASALTSTSFSMEHAEMKAARNANEARRIGNQALHDRDAARGGAAPALYVSAVATVGLAVQPLLDDCAAATITVVNNFLDAELAADGPLFVAVPVAPVALASGLFGPNAGHTPIAQPAGVNREQIKAAIALAVRDELTMVELAHHNAAVQVVADNKLSTTFGVIDGTMNVLRQKVQAYLNDMLGPIAGTPDGVLLAGGTANAGEHRDAFVARLMLDLEAAY